MLDDLKKSINSNLYERARSPLYGTLVLSWFVWNWKFIYYLLVVSSNTPFFVRMHIVEVHLTSAWTLLWGPVLSSIVILIGFEFVANYAFWLHVYYKTWRVNKKVQTEGRQLLTYEQSLKLRGDIRNQEEQYERLIQEKEDIISELNNTIQNLQTTLNSINKNEVVSPVKSQGKSKLDRIKQILITDDNVEVFKRLYSEIVNGKEQNQHFEPLNSFVALGLFKRGPHVGGHHYEYWVTELGTQLYQKLVLGE